MCLEYHGLYPFLYFSSPALSWDVILKIAGVKLDLILFTYCKYHYIEKGIRGGVSYITRRYSKAKNKYMESYNKLIPSKYIIYKDANNLYERAMSKYFLFDEFKPLTQDEIERLDVNTVPEHNPEGYILEVGLEYPKRVARFAK